MIQIPGMIGSLHSWIQNRSKIDYKCPKEVSKENSRSTNNQIKLSRTLKIGKRKCKISSSFRPRSVRIESFDIHMNITDKLEALQSEIKYLKTKVYERTESKTKIEI